jgi:hypothetical protein
MLFWGVVGIESSGILVGWKYYGKPPGQVSSLISTEFDTLYVQTASEQILECRWNVRNGDCWFETSEAGSYIDPDADNCDFPATARRPPGRVIDRLDSKFCGVDISSRITYALLEDGTIWYSAHGSASTFWGLICLAGSWVAAFVGFVAGIAQKRRLDQRERAPLTA